MAEASKSRLSLDLEEIERQLRRSSPQAAHAKSDPLAELARIVGQDDPFRALLGGDGPAPHRAAGDIFARREPLFDHPGQEGPENYGLRGSLAEEGTSYADAYRDQPIALTAEEEALLHGHQGQYYADPHDPALYYDDGTDYAESSYAPVQPRRSRKGLIAAGAVVAAAALAGAGAWTLRSGDPLGPDGEPPVVQAEAGPSKIAPQNPGGIDIPNQNKKIYEPVSQDTQTRVVNREEQPVDLRQAIRAGGSAAEAGIGAGPVRLSPAVPPNAIPPAGAVPSLQGSGNAIAGVLGEPRRVRTVSIRPDGTVIAPDAGAPARPAASPSLAMPETLRPAPAASAGPSAPQGAIPQRPRETTPSPVDPRVGSAAAPAIGAPLQITPDTARPKGDARLAAAPMGMVREPAETSAAPSTPPGFTVQLGVRDTERDARLAFNQFQQRYAGDLSGFSPIILQAEINGRTAYRVRVGPMSRDDATSLCTRLKAAGGQCFVANN